MADDILREGDAALDGALGRFERAEAELDETEERRRRLVEEAAVAAAELERITAASISTAIATRDRLEEELAIVVDHITRLEAIRARSAGDEDLRIEKGCGATIDDGSVANDPPAHTELREEQWVDLMRSHHDDTAFTS